jgi:tRNA pseudouridine38-40 synthase
MSTQRYKLVVAYRGTRYHGWQAQASKKQSETNAPPPESLDPNFLTVQSTISSVMSAVLNDPIEVVGSSRTDSGVHAKGQICHFDTIRTQVPQDKLRKAVNNRLPPDIVIRKIEKVPDSFDAIRSTLSKRYQYQIWNTADRPVFFADLAWHRWHRLDVHAMQAAATHFVGEHDFASFARPGHGRLHTVRTIRACDVSRRGPRLVIAVEATGFLWNMVRIIVGTLADVGIHRYEPDDIPQMLAARDRQAAGPTAPPHGLFLQWVKVKPTVDAAPATPAASSEPPAE